MSSLSSLPDDVVLKCLVRVPRRYYQNISCVSKRLRSLVRSPELHRLRSLFHKNSIYLYCLETMKFNWFTLSRSEKKTAIEYQLVR
ncbi:putative F-box domain-containing protein [Arabidopsis thaliana]